MRIALTQVGPVETEGNNWGPRPRKYLASVGIDFAAPYCGAGIHWTFRTAGKTLLPARPFALAVAWNPKDRRIWGRGAATDTTAILPADVTGHDYGNGIHHTNLIVIDQGKYIKIVGFNTTDGIVRDGTGVYCKIIMKAQTTCVSRWLPR